MQMQLCTLFSPQCMRHLPGCSDDDVSRIASKIHLISYNRSWDQYDQNCSAAYVGVFLPQIPAGTAVPHWAYMNVTVSFHANPCYYYRLIFTIELRWIQCNICATTQYAHPCLCCFVY